MGKGWNYTEVLGLLSAQISRLESKLDGMDEKLTNDHGRITKLETERGTDYRWVKWVGGAVIMAIELYEFTTL